jgi:hypothetical protein
MHNAVQMASIAGDKLIERCEAGEYRGSLQSYIRSKRPVALALEVASLFLLSA